MGNYITCTWVTLVLDSRLNFFSTTLYVDWAEHKVHFPGIKKSNNIRTTILKIGHQQHKKRSEPFCHPSILTYKNSSSFSVMFINWKRVTVTSRGRLVVAVAGRERRSPLAPDRPVAWFSMAQRKTLLDVVQRRNGKALAAFALKQRCEGPSSLGLFVGW
jgi:hypothetical protein